MGLENRTENLKRIGWLFRSTVTDAAEPAGGRVWNLVSGELDIRLNTLTIFDIHKLTDKITTVLEDASAGKDIDSPKLLDTLKSVRAMHANKLANGDQRLTKWEVDEMVPVDSKRLEVAEHLVSALYYSQLDASVNEDKYLIRKRNRSLVIEKMRKSAEALEGCPNLFGENTFNIFNGIRVKLIKGNGLFRFDQNSIPILPIKK